jgi:hypothetical protein
MPQTSTPSATPPVVNARKRSVYIFGAMAASLLLAVALVLWMFLRTKDPRLNSDTVTLVKFIASDRYARLPLEQQAPYMQVIETREDNGEIKELFETGRISESEYRAALLEAWLGEQFKRSERYAALPAGSTRQEYVRELLDKKSRRKKDTASAKAGGAGKGSPAAKIKRDGAAEDLRIAAWPAEARKRWEDFRKAYDAEKEARDAAEAQAEGGTARAGQPTPE